ncbi:MAG: hypothetical protein CO088_00635 [Candidatus Yonathbacteria bacterium CG_4_9_14_0_8_um_filter_46_47]|uniref:DUF7282 domain-containing protein n=1 Tax=Candidatus Yonathbacteria bacterium CG_4_9_14_0_8_um_filter_46_47 TaxID=1975106 RepID=A0A2M8D9K5_9BACT|nr:MAG: hypothetical protein CO088_00635 [Candidatus Yonathbacteria bacterium CG_4_9_14_0_8_um_filter_46_47]
MDKRITVFVVVIVLVIIGFFGVNSLFKEKIIAPVSPESPIGGEASSTPLVVPDQAGGAQIFIGRAMLPGSGFIVVKKTSEGVTGTTTGEVIGVSDLFFAGTQENILINISQEVIEGDTLTAALYLDDGDGEYTLADEVIIDENGNPFTATFTILSEGALENEVKL